MKNLKNKPNNEYLTTNNSFTLIELLIVIIIIIIFGGISLAYYNNFTEEKKLETEIQKLVDVLELAKKKTSANDTGNYSCSNFSGYRVTVQNSTYQLILCCSLDCSNNRIIKNYNLPNNFTVISGIGNIQFKPLTQTISPKTLQLKANSLNKCSSISINSAGVISIENNSNCTQTTLRWSCSNQCESPIPGGEFTSQIICYNRCGRQISPPNQ